MDRLRDGDSNGDIKAVVDETLAPFQKELAILATTLKNVYTFCYNLFLPVPETSS